MVCFKHKPSVGSWLMPRKESERYSVLAQGPSGFRVQCTLRKLKRVRQWLREAETSTVFDLDVLTRRSGGESSVGSLARGLPLPAIRWHLAPCEDGFLSFSFSYVRPYVMKPKTAGPERSWCGTEALECSKPRFAWLVPRFERNS